LSADLKILNSYALPDEPSRLMFWREWPVKSSKGNMDLIMDLSFLDGIK
jgi:hypothetical protein